MKTVVIGALAALLLAGPDITRARLETSLASTFVNMYNLQQHVQVGTSVFPSSDPTI